MLSAYPVLLALLIIALPANKAYSQDFTKGQTFSTGVSPYGLKTADLNKDGKLDLILIVNSYYLEVHLGNGNGTFAAAGTQYDTGIRWSDIGKVTEFEVADVNNDGNPDLIAVGGRQLAVLKGNGNGTFQSAQQFQGSDPGSEADLDSLGRGDFNKDGKPDFATGNPVANLIDIFYGNGDGTFTLRSYPAADTNLTTDLTPSEVEAGDLDGDGNDDLVFWDCCTPDESGPNFNVRAWYGNGSGEFTDKRFVTQDANRFRLKVFDINKDGRADVVGTEDTFGCNEGPTGCGGSVRTFLYSGSRTFQLYAGQELVGNGFRRFPFTGAAIDDFNGDGLLDLAAGLSDISQAYPDVWAVFPRRADNAIDSSSPYDLGPGGTKRPSEITSGDFNGDRFPDIAVSLAITSEVTVYLNSGKGQDEESCLVDSPESKAKICRPLANATVNNPAHIVAGASFQRSYTSAKLYVDGVTKASVSFDRNGIQNWLNASPTLAAGQHEITVRFWEPSGQFVSQTTRINVLGGSNACHTSNGQVNICSPLSGTTVSSPVHVVAATGNSGNITGNRVYVDGVSKFAGSGPVIDTSIAMSAGTHTITAKFWTSSGASYSKAVTFIVSGGSSTCSASNGQVNICSPQSGDTVGSPVHVVAATGNTRNITGNRVYVDGVSKFSGSGPKIDASIAMTAGTRMITVKFWNSSGASFNKAVTVNVH